MRIAMKAAFSFAGYRASKLSLPHFVKIPHMQSSHTALFFDACRQNNTAALQQLFDQHPDLVHTPDAKGFTPLIIAVYNNAPDAVAFLLHKGAAINAADAAGNTALMGASFKGYGAIVKTLLQAGADVAQRNGSGATALTFAATFGQMQIAEDLLQHGASVHVTDARGKSPIDHAVIQENEAMVRLLERYERGEG